MMRRPDQNNEQEASSTDLLTELLLPVYLAAWTRASIRSQQHQPSAASHDQVNADADRGVADDDDPGDGAVHIFRARTEGDAEASSLESCALQNLGSGLSCAGWSTTTTSVRSGLCATAVPDLVCGTSPR